MAGDGLGSIIYLSTLSGVDNSCKPPPSQTVVSCAARNPSRHRANHHHHVDSENGNPMSMGYEKTILLYNPSTYETADIISSYVYRAGLIEQDWSYSTAIGLFNSVINCILLFVTNQISKRTTESSLW
ncbi:MAG: hypothetical protein ACLVAW_12210 [Eisenbergiella massiliensis]